MQSVLLLYKKYAVASLDEEFIYSNSYIQCHLEMQAWGREMRGPGLCLIMNFICCDLGQGI